MEPFNYIILAVFFISVLLYILARRKKFYNTISFILYLILVVFMIIRYYYDYTGAVDMFVLIEHGSLQSVPDIIKNIHITNSLFIAYSFLYVLSLVVGKSIKSSE